MAAKKKTVNPLLTQAQQAAQAKIQPELEALSTLRGQALGDYSTARSQANAAAQIIAQGATQAQGGLADFLKRAGVAQGQITGPSSSEAQMVAQNLGLTSQAAGAGLAKIISDAPQAAAYQTQAARRTYDSANSQINDRLQQLSSDYGTDAVDEYNKLFNADQQNRLKLAGIRQTATNAAAGRKNSRTIAGVTADGSLIPGGTLDTKEKAAAAKTAAAKQKATAGVLPGGVKPLTGTEFGTFQKAYQSASQLAGHVKDDILSGQLSAGDAILALTQGHPGTPSSSKTVYVRDPATGQVVKDTHGNPKTRQETIPGSPKQSGTGDPLATTAAVEYALYGGISAATARKLHAQGVTAKRLGIAVIPQPVFDQKVRTRKQSSQKTKAASDQVFNGI